jgi:hypothetical protein
VDLLQYGHGTGRAERKPRLVHPITRPRLVGYLLRLRGNLALQFDFVIYAVPSWPAVEPAIFRHTVLE